MRTLHNVTLIACLFCILPKAMAGEKIEGAFGLKLGDVFDPAKAIFTHSPNNTRLGMPLEPEYGITVTNANKMFDSFFIQITPKTHKIYRIVARGNEVTEQERKDALASLRERFETLNQGTRRIALNTFTTGGLRSTTGRIIPRKITTELSYTDRDLQDLALKEAAEQKSPK